MQANKTIHVCGSIIKKESIAPIVSNIAEHTCVAEANMPYSNYYSNVPKKAKPNSLFLFTTPIYSLEEVLRFAWGIDSCLMKDVNVATSVLSFQTRQVSAIRIKNFPNYEQIKQLQNCFIQQGVVFAKKIQFEKETLARISKCFVLEELEENIFIDKLEKDKGYISIPRLISYNEFTELISEVRNNSNCSLFDSAKAGIIINSQLTDFIRIYSERLDLEFIRCIKNKITQLLKNKG